MDPFVICQIASVGIATLVILVCKHMSGNMSNLTFRTSERTHAVAVVLLVCFLPLQIPRACACRILNTPCASECPCAAQNEVLRWQCSDPTIAGTCELGCRSDMTRQSHDDPMRECRCTNVSPVVITKVARPAEHDLECRILLDRGETIDWFNSSHSSISADAIAADGRCTPLERCVAMCRLKL